MEEQEDIDEILKPNWNINEKLTYSIWKKDTFEFDGSESDVYEREYLIELRLLEDNIVEAYFPQSILSIMKLFTNANKYFPRINHSQNNTIYFQVDENFKFLEIKNSAQLLENISNIKSQLQEIVSENELEDILDDMKVLEKTPKYADKYFRQDIETIHDFYGSVIYDGYYFDLLEQRSIAKTIKSKMLGFVKLDIGKIDILQSGFDKDSNYCLELLRGQDTISTLNRQNFKEIEEQFLGHEFDINDHKDITLHHQKYLYDADDYILRSYQYEFKIDTPKMLKHMQGRIVLLN